MKSLRKLTQNPSFLLLNCLNVDTISTKLQFSEGGGYIFMAKKKKGKKISTKMLSAMLPVLILGMAVLGAVSVFSSKQIIDDEDWEGNDAESGKREDRGRVTDAVCGKPCKTYGWNCWDYL